MNSHLLCFPHTDSPEPPPAAQEQLPALEQAVLRLPELCLGEMSQIFCGESPQGGAAALHGPSGQILQPTICFKGELTS